MDNYRGLNLWGSFGTSLIPKINDYVNDAALPNMYTTKLLPNLQKDNNILNLVWC